MFDQWKFIHESAGSVCCNISSVIAKGWSLFNSKPAFCHSGHVSRDSHVFFPPSVQYCHFVAGLVGIGLSQLFSASQLEDPEVGQDTELANSMGLFLQKTNIIRDYLEDTLEGRAFWPQEVEPSLRVGVPDLR